MLILKSPKVQAMNSNNILMQILVWLIPCAPAITLHECAHGWMALRLGDPTARDANRLSLNPLRHVDPVGTFILPGLMLLAHMPFVFGWAKPVPVDFGRLRGGRRGVVLVALARPLANFAMMLGWLGLAALSGAFGAPPDNRPNSAMDLLAQLSLAGAAVNMILMLFNLIPIPPLDGGRILGAILPRFLARPYMLIERFGTLILLILIATGIFNRGFDRLMDKFLSMIGAG